MEFCANGLQKRCKTREKRRSFAFFQRLFYAKFASVLPNLGSKTLFLSFFSLENFSNFFFRKKHQNRRTLPEAWVNGHFDKVLRERDVRGDAPKSIDSPNKRRTHHDTHHFFSHFFARNREISDKQPKDQLDGEPIDWEIIPMSWWVSLPREKRENLEQKWTFSRKKNSEKKYQKIWKKFSTIMYQIYRY